MGEPGTDNWQWLSGEDWSYSDWCDNSYEDQGITTTQYNQALLDEGYAEVEAEILEYSDTFDLSTEVRVDNDPRPNTQPNGNSDMMAQHIMGFGELNLPIPQWADYFANVSNYDDTGTVATDGLPIKGSNERDGRSRGFIIEWDSNPN